MVLYESFGSIDFALQYFWVETPFLDAWWNCEVIGKNDLHHRFSCGISFAATHWKMQPRINLNSRVSPSLAF
jgi:hypothetical protein